MVEHKIIGSRWLLDMYPESELVNRRVKPNADFDILIGCEPTDEISTYFKSKFGNKTELHHIPILWDYIQSHPNDPNALFTLKSSHVFFHKQWFEKTIYDLYLMNSLGCKVIEPLFYDLYNFWCNKFGEPWRADFTKESSEFFDDAVSRENVHDQLHNLVSDPNLGQPAFKFLQEPNQTTVWVCPEKFKNCDEYIRHRVVIEEARTLALERDVLSGNLPNKTIAYQRWLKALIHRLSPLWMVPYIINNIYYFLSIQEDYG